MGWQRGEMWLDTDVLWFREPTESGAGSLALNAPRFLGLTPGALAAAIPNGLAESRRRRAELRRRRSARKTRAAALVVGPAVVLTVATPRLGAGLRGDEPLTEDPPSLATGLGLALPEAEGTASTPSPQATGRKQPLTREALLPKIHWHRAESHGLPYSGSLTGGTQLPVEGPDWVTWNPVKDRVPNQPQRLYGHERTVRKVVSVLTAYRAAHPHAPRVVVGDLSFPGGGPMEQHRSHQNGLDVDVYYPRLDRALRAPTGVAQVDRKLAQDLVDRFVAAGAQKVFVGTSTGLHGPHEVVIPYPNHLDHMHVRFRPPRNY